MEKKAVLVSNALQSFKSNNLSEFQNRLPENYLEDHLEWSSSVETIGFHLRLRNKGTCNDSTFPSFIQAKSGYFLQKPGVSFDEHGNLKDVSLSTFEQWQVYYLEENEDYPPKKLNYVWRWRTAYFSKTKSHFFSGSPTKMSADGSIEFGQFESNLDLTDRDNLNFLFFHENFFNAIDIERKDFKKVYIDTQMYYYMLYSKPLKSKNFCKGLIIQLPKVIQLCSKTIDQKSYNPMNIVKRFAVYPEEIGQYVTKVFSKENYVEVGASPRSFHLCLVDENFENLVLSSGIPTYCKIHFTAKEMKTFSLFVNSKNDESISSVVNKANSFRVLLPSRINLSIGEWRVALSSISYKYKLHILDELWLDYYVQDRSKSMDEIKHSIPKSLSSLEEIITYFFNSIKDLVTYEYDKNGLLKLEFQNLGRLRISKPLAIILGGNNSSQGSFLEIFRGRGSTYLFEKKPQFLPVFPTSFYIYSDVVEESIIGEMHAKLLKIVPLKEESVGKYFTYEANQLEFLDISTKEISEMSFEIRTHTGKLFQFEQDTDVFIDLIFKNFKV